MQLETGKLVIYHSSEICKIEGLEKKNLDGVNEREYCVLVPVSTQRGRYYVPKEVAEQKLRSLLTKDEVLAVIDSVKNSSENALPSADSNRKGIYDEVLSSGDCGKILALICGLYLEKQKRLSENKKFPAAEERAMKTAESLIFKEFGFVLDIPESEVGSYIGKRLNGTDNSPNHKQSFPSAAHKNSKA